MTPQTSPELATFRTFDAADLDPWIAERLSRVRYIITDLDGTMLVGAKVTVDSDGEPSANMVQTLVDLQRAGIQVVPCSGRNRSMIFEDARLLGLKGWIAEMGGLLCTKSGSQPEWQYFTGDMDYTPKSNWTPHDLIISTGVIAKMLAGWRGHIETYHDNYVGFEYREVTVALRGDAPASELQEVLDEFPLPLYLSDNGLVRAIAGETSLVAAANGIEHPQGIHTYHVMPKGVTKGTAIARYCDLMGWDPDEVLCAGDSPADCEMAGYVGTFMFMRNGIKHPDAVAELCKHDNIFVSGKPSIDGWAEVARTIMDLRG